MPRLLIVMMVCVLLAGCRQQQADLPRLVELDSLIAVAPDSAAALLAAYPDDSLRTDDDRAYHALLLTQAKYKAYIHAYSLDTINMAVAHYADGHDTGKRTRSLLYKGCVFEDLSRLDSAMYYYKYAEDMATQSGDTYHRGYALMRQAWMYQCQYDTRCAIDLYRMAFLEYGLWQDYGTGRETPRGNSGDIGRTKVRQRRKWFSRKYYASVMRLKEFYEDNVDAHSLAF